MSNDISVIHSNFKHLNFMASDTKYFIHHNLILTPCLNSKLICDIVKHRIYCYKQRCAVQKRAII